MARIAGGEEHAGDPLGAQVEAFRHGARFHRCAPCCGIAGSAKACAFDVRINRAKQDVAALFGRSTLFGQIVGQLDLQALRIGDTSDKPDAFAGKCGEVDIAAGGIAYELQRRLTQQGGIVGSAGAWLGQKAAAIEPVE